MYSGIYQDDIEIKDFEQELEENDYFTGIEDFDNENRNQRVTVQSTEKEKARLKILAKITGLTLSDYIRQKALYEPYNEIFKNKKRKVGF